MKRVWLALGLLIGAVGLCVGSLLFQQHQIDGLLADLDRLETAYRAGELEDCRQLAEQLNTDYARRAKLFSCFMSHNELDESLTTAATLPACLEEENPEEFLLETAKFRQELEYLREVEAPVLHNIF